MGSIAIDIEQLKLKFAENPPANLFDPSVYDFACSAMLFPCFPCMTATIYLYQAFHLPKLSIYNLVSRLFITMTISKGNVGLLITTTRHSKRVGTRINIWYPCAMFLLSDVWCHVVAMAWFFLDMFSSVNCCHQLLHVSCGFGLGCSSKRVFAWSLSNLAM
jgi:hypothetical protein